MIRLLLCSVLATSCFGAGPEVSDAPPLLPALDSSLEPETVAIPAGVFLMGTSAAQGERILEIGGEDWEEYISWSQPQHRVHLAAYRIGKYPVTNRQYSAFVEEAGHPAPAHWQAGRPAPDQGEHPVGNIRWADAVAYCSWLSERTGKSYRLPTEAQWEKAARGPDGLFYPWGDAWDPSRLNSREAGPGALVRVGSYSPRGDSPYGVADMAGQLWEWVSDRYHPDIYKMRGELTEDPVGAESGDRYVLRGGAFNLDGILLGHTAVRDHHDGVNVAIDDGFRVVLSGDGS